MRHLRILLICLTLVSTGFADDVDFERDVAAVLETRCLSCHQSDEPGGDVRLDRRENLATVISINSPDESLILEQIGGHEPAMPKDGESLTIEQVAKLRQWIATGAAWPGGRVLKDKPIRDMNWWSLKPLKEVIPPSTGHPVDAFINAKLAELELVPVPKSDPLTLLRRVSFDLTGLPPTPERCDAFEQACKGPLGEDAAFEQLVDELLSSPAFGEHWARHWLDVVRYGETHGYDKDQPRMNAWPYRDYVINSFNGDKPFDRFAQEQIAGDALFLDNADGILGLGFLAAGPWDLIGHVEVGEGKVDGRIAKHLDRDEMIAAVFNVFTSTTVQCAQCHHHKFDPVTMDDYYRLHAVFAAVDRADRVYEGLPADQEKKRLATLDQIKKLQAKYNTIDSDINGKIAARTGRINQRIIELKKEFGSDLKPQYGWHSQIAAKANDAKWVQVDLGEPKTISTVVLYPCYDDFANIGAGFGFPPSYRVEVSNDANFDSNAKQVYVNAHPGPKGIAVEFDVKTEPFRYIRVTAQTLATRQNDFIFALGELQAFNDDRDLENNLVNHALRKSVSALDSIESGDRWARENLTDGISFQELRSPEAMEELTKLRIELGKIEAEIRTDEVVKRLQSLADKRRVLEGELATFPEGEKVFAAATHFSAQGSFIATQGKPRAIHRLVRGDIRKPSTLMQPGMIPLWPAADAEFSLPTDAPEYAARAILAESITDRSNPLFWRSIANRVWQGTFGQAIVATPNDFGRMGTLPTHPELLDWLAISLRDDPKHSLKSLIRLMVTSEAYRRSSLHEDANAKRDANNQFLWRANRRRLSAEEIRDAILQISGKLPLNDAGGPSFQDFVIEKPEHSPHYEYDKYDPDDRRAHRRSIYRFVVRSQPQPFLTSLDCADPSLSVAARDESTTAIQALTLWNSRFTEALSRQFASRIDREVSDHARVNLAARATFGRPPTDREFAVLQEHLETYGSASLARILFNLNAFLYVD